MPKKGEPEPVQKPTVSVYLRHQRELNKAITICEKEIKYLEAEKAALELQVKEAHDDYAL
jgi:hypothetical protein